MNQPSVHRARLPGEGGSPGVARRLVRAALRDSGLDDLADDALLLTSELCENAVLHAGTGFELEITVGDGELTIAVTDQGATAMEIHRAAPTPRRATHNRGLQMVDALAAAWGTRHDERGHQIWFTLRLDEAATGPKPSGELDLRQTRWPDVATSRWLLHLPANHVATLPTSVLTVELLRRLGDVLQADGGTVSVDNGTGERELARYGSPAGNGHVIAVELPLSAPLRGRLRIRTAERTAEMTEIAGLSAQRIALAVEADWARDAERKKWSWLSHLAEASELLAQSLDVELTAAIVPQIMVPRLGRWCAVHLLDQHDRLRLRALTHVDETTLAELRAGLQAGAAGRPHDTLRGLLSATAGDAAGLAPPIAGIAVPLKVRGRALGTVSVGRRTDRQHDPDEVLMISELARRAAQAIDNAQRNATQVATAQALQQALLPRALPARAEVEFAAAYLPASAGADVGGDFYDVLEIGDGSWLASVGDVCGKGPRAAARTSLVRDVLRVLVREGHSLVRSVELLNDMMLEAHDPDQFATMASAFINRDPAGAGLDVELVLAGHDQPLMVRADGTVAPVGQHGNALGLVSRFRVHATRHHLDPGESLVFYTDGVTERRRAQEQFGPERLVEAVAAIPASSAKVLVAGLRQIINVFSTEPQQDDIVIMVVRAPRH
ncbi:MAG TPA: SpoIIE family protein phosphatase [Actinophytocola sp.]|uniref:SpoIIE family protein phosphatase n=1 Tax=Actinophytocola sp. TaxID=1872138 RepID=UPI002DB6C25B|nr:SpoIIE family protein phosphatase [Actinophytocola sp.]HEU5471590.1 SpoIIE family protein phosphatase [Actinophytocola sp.]